MLRVSGFGSMVSGLVLGVWCLVFRIWCLESRVSELDDSAGGLVPISPWRTLLKLTIPGGWYKTVNFGAKRGHVAPNSKDQIDRKLEDSAGSLLAPPASRTILELTPSIPWMHPSTLEPEGVLSPQTRKAKQTLNYSAEMWSGSEDGSNLRLIDRCITQL